MANMAYGGWYDSPNGRNQRYWGNGVWTDGPEPGQTQASSNSGGSSSQHTIPAFTIPNYQSYVDTANKSLDSYYQRILDEEGGDVDRAKRRLEEDYQKGMRISNEDYVKGNTRASEDTGVARTNEQALETGEDRQLQGNLVSRGVSQGGVANTLTGEQSDRQRLRREAIDRALSRTQQDLQYGKERSQEDTTITQRRGTEDVASGYAKFVTQQKMNKEKDAAQLANDAYNRDFQTQQAKQNFALQGGS